MKVNFNIEGQLVIKSECRDDDINMFKFTKERDKHSEESKPKKGTFLLIFEETEDYQNINKPLIATDEDRF